MDLPTPLNWSALTVHLPLSYDEDEDEPSELTR